MTEILTTTALLSALMMASLQGCGNSKEAASEETPAYITEAQKQFGDAYECEPNATEEFILCSHNPDSTAVNALARIAFFVFDVAKNEVTIQQREVRGRARWVSDYQIEMVLSPGIVTSDGQGAPVYRIDVRSGERRRIDGVDTTPK